MGNKASGGTKDKTKKGKTGKKGVATDATNRTNVGPNNDDNLAGKDDGNNVGTGNASSQRISSQEKVATNKKPQLMRMRSDGKLESCSICLDSKSKGLSCEANHFICVDCFSPYVESICDDMGKLKDNKFEVACPVPNCTSPHWNSFHIRTILEGKALEKYIDTLIKACSQADAAPAVNTSAAVAAGPDSDKIKATAAMIVDSLSMKCPKCKVVLDPNPDGCCAMKCLGCATYFCWLCFATQSNSTVCHQHVRACPMSTTPGNVFVPKEGVNIAHANRRIVAIHNILVKYWFDANPQEVQFSKEKLKTSPGVIRILRSCQRELSDLNIDPDAILENRGHNGGPANAPIESRRKKYIRAAFQISVFVIAAYVVANILYSGYLWLFAPKKFAYAVTASGRRLPSIRFNLLLKSVRSWVIWDGCPLVLSVIYYVLSNGSDRSLTYLLLAVVFYARAFLFRVLIFVAYRVLLLSAIGAAVLYLYFSRRKTTIRRVR
jgi:hypothetical protein